MASTMAEVMHDQKVLDFEHNVADATTNRNSLMAEAAFYSNPEWETYRDSVLEPRYRGLCDTLVFENDTVAFLRIQGEARAIKYQLGRAASVLQELEDAKDRLADLALDPPSLPGNL